MDWNEVLNEATQYFQEYLRIETVNPPGNEIEGARFFKKIFDRESIPCEIFEPSPGRGNILATLRGDGLKRPILLLSHMDVVPVEREKWEVDPFSGTVKDGYFYGRGALDNKAMGIMELMVLLVLKRTRLPLKRDILFLATADEEAGGRWGVRWAVENLPQIPRIEYALNEGGYIILTNGGLADRYEISNGQKVIFQLRLKARGTSGHASLPHPDNPNVKLVDALKNVTEWKTPFLILPEVKTYFSKIAPKQIETERTCFEDIEKGLRDPAFSSRFTSNVLFNAMVRDTISLTVLQAGSKANVIPSEATAILDCRLIPGRSKKEFLRDVNEKLGPGIEVEIISESESLPPSSLETELYRAIESFAQKQDPGCPVVPHLLAGATDSRFLREKGMIAYDFCFARLDEKELLRIHGHNERISLENLRFGMEMMTEVIKKVAT